MGENGMIGRFDHCGFATRDLDATLEFWTRIIGLDSTGVVERCGDWIASFTGIPDAKLRIAHLFGTDVHLEFIEFTSGGDGRTLPASANTTGHVCLKVDDLDEVHRRILAAGGTALGRPTTITEGALAGRRGVYLRDPNGLIVELLEAP